MPLREASRVRISWVRLVPAGSRTVRPALPWSGARLSWRRSIFGSATTEGFRGTRRGAPFGRDGPPEGASGILLLFMCVFPFIVTRRAFASANYFALWHSNHREHPPRRVESPHFQRTREDHTIKTVSGFYEVARSRGG